MYSLISFLLPFLKLPVLFSLFISKDLVKDFPIAKVVEVINEKRKEGDKFKIAYSFFNHKAFLFRVKNGFLRDVVSVEVVAYYQDFIFSGYELNLIGEDCKNPFTKNEIEKFRILEKYINHQTSLCLCYCFNYEEDKFSFCEKGSRK